MTVYEYFCNLYEIADDTLNLRVMQTNFLENFQEKSNMTFTYDYYEDEGFENHWILSITYLGNDTYEFNYWCPQYTTTKTFKTIVEFQELAMLENIEMFLDI